MVRKVKTLLVAVFLLALFGATCTAAQAESYQVYDGNPSSTYLQYFRDTISGIGLGDNYVAFRSGQYTYTMVVGDLTYNAGTFSSSDTCTVYTMQSDNSYNGYYTYSVGEISSFSLNAEDKILYSDLGNYPQFEERGAKYEILTTILIVACCVGFVCRSVFRYRPR